MHIATQEAPKSSIKTLKTPWAKNVSQDAPHPEYPRPQMVRGEWQNLNGKWDLTFGDRPGTSHSVLVPFPVESLLSNVHSPVGPQEELSYHREFTIPPSWKGMRVLLHFGAVDWATTVVVNNEIVGHHRGGFDPFSFDITHALDDDPTQSLRVDVVDPHDTCWQPRGKQVQDPSGIFYTPSSGIWQTVWLEAVPQTYISDFHLVPDIDKAELRITATIIGEGAQRLIATARDRGEVVAEGNSLPGEELVLKIARPKLWSPQSPFLYDLHISLETDRGVDEFESYFGMRKISVGKYGAITRIMLNNKPEFMIGPLDQGYWPDGLFTPPTEAALKFDIEFTKQCGFNTIRKHMKLEPARFYYWCDKLGVLVWQDMPSGYASGAAADQEPDAEDALQFRDELKAMVHSLKNYPSIVIWTVFNEGWGQHNTEALTAWVKELDPTRLTDNASGWTDKNCGDIVDMHNYPGPGMPEPEEARAAVLGEFGGLGLPAAGHMWKQRGWSYQGFRNSQQLTDAMVQLFHNIHPLIGQGLSAAIYTQTTDVETEMNGLLSYDRKVIKAKIEPVREAIEGLFAPPPSVVPVVPTSQKKGIVWCFTTEQPPEEWIQPSFSDRHWDSGLAGFGTEGTPGAVVRTKWNTKDIWIRRRFTLESSVRFEAAHLWIHHDEDAEVYLDGRLIANATSFVSNYIFFPADLKEIPAGEHTLAVHCRQTIGGQNIDVGIVDLVFPCS